MHLNMWGPLLTYKSNIDRGLNHEPFYGMPIFKQRYLNNREHRVTEMHFARDTWQ